MKQTTAMQMQESATLNAGHGLAKRNVQIEEQKIDDVTVQQAIGQIAEHAGEEQSERDAPPRIARLAPQQQDGDDDDERDAGERDEEAVVVPEGAEGGAGVRDVDEGEEIGDDRARLVGIDEAEDETFGHLVEGVEGQGEEKENSHARASTTAAQRSHNSGCAALAPTVARWRQQRAHFSLGVLAIEALGSSAGSSFRSLRMKNSSSSSRGGKVAKRLSQCKTTAASSALPISFSWRAFSIAWPMTPRSLSNSSTSALNDESRKLRLRLRKQLQVHRAAAAEITPRFFRGEDQDRREQPAKRVEDLAHRRLRRAAARRIGRVAIHPVLGDVDVEAAQVDRAELVERVINLVEFVGRVGRAAIRDHVLQPIENPAIDEREIAWDAVPGGSSRLLSGSAWEIGKVA